MYLLVFARIRGFVQESADTGRFDLLQFPSCQGDGVFGVAQGNCKVLGIKKT